MPFQDEGRGAPRRRHRHGGLDATYHIISKQFQWPKMRNDIQDYIKQCNICQRYNVRPMTIRTHHVPIGESHHIVGIDLIGTLPVTPRGNRFVIVAVDYLTHWVEAKAIPEKTADAIAEFIKFNIIARHGPPKILISDQGTEFVNVTVNALLRTCGITHITSSPYHPQTNGLTERTNQSLIQKLAKGADSPTNWDTALNFSVFAYNISYQRKLMASPFELLYGRSPTLIPYPSEPVNDDTATLESTLNKRSRRPVAITQARKRNQQRIKKLQKRARKRIKQEQDKSKKQQEKLPTAEDLNVGDTVVMRDHLRTSHLGSKLRPRWSEPGKISNKGKNGHYIVQFPDGTKQTNRRDIRRFLQSEPYVYLNSVKVQ